MGPHHCAALLTCVEVLLDDRPFLGVDGVEGVGAQHLLDLGVVHTVTPASVSVSRSFASPLRILLLIVPSGVSSSAATSR